MKKRDRDFKKIYILRFRFRWNGKNCYKISILCQIQLLIWLQYVFHVPRIQTAHNLWGLLVSSVQKLLEKIGDLRAIAILVKLNLGIFGICWSTLKPDQIVSDYHPTFFILGIYICFLRIKKKNIWCLVCPVLPRSSK